MRRRRIRNGALAALAAATFAYGAGFLVFAATLPRPSEATPQALLDRAGDVPRETRGLVALTGGAGLRIAHAMSLYEAGLADRVLISGVNPAIGREELAASGAGDAELLACCADLGPFARTTRGNAVEARAWLRAHGYGAVYLVTSNFHLPRAEAELRRLAPELTVIGVPVDSRSVPERGWVTKPIAWRTLLGEYLKLTAVRLRGLVD